jgi:aspartate/methionine/tyrosine aminotransferase
MLRETRVEYLAWAKNALSHPAPISLINSGVSTLLSDLDVDPQSVLTTEVAHHGDTQIRTAIANRYGVSEDEVFSVLGTSMGLFLASGAVLGPGEEALVERPGYESLSRVVEAHGGGAVYFPRREVAGWTLEPEQVFSCWTSETRLILVSDPHNPTGQPAGDDALREVGEEAGRRGALLLVDEVYRDIRPGPVGTSRHLGEAVIAVSSLTKVYGLGGLRAGWVLAPPEIVARLQDMINVLEAVDPEPSVPFIRGAFRKADSLLERSRALAEEGWRVVEDWMGGHGTPRIIRPQAGIFAWVVLPEGISGTEAADRLLEEGVGVTPGRFFGDDTGFRFTFGIGNPELLREGLDAFGRVLGED